MRKFIIVLTAALFLVNCAAGPLERLRDQLAASCNAGAQQDCRAVEFMGPSVEQERQERAAQVGAGILAFTGAILLGAAMGAAAAPQPYPVYHSRTTVIIRR